MMMLYLASGSHQQFYQRMQKYVVIESLKIYWSKPSENIIPNSICIMF